MSATRLIPTLPGPRRSEEFARLLDSAALGDLSHADDPALAPLLTIAQGLRTLPHDGAPREEFRTALRQRLVAVATVQTQTAPAPAPRRIRTLGWQGQRRVAVATGTVAAVIAVAGVAVGASRSLPGDPLYGVKRGTEAAQLLVTTGTDERGRKHLDYARTRLQEISEMLAPGSALGVDGAALGQPLAAGPVTGSIAGRLTDALSDMDADTLAGSRDLTEAFRDSHERAPLLTLQEFAASQRAELAALLPAFPAAALPRGEQSVTLLDAVGERADELLSTGTCSHTCTDPSLGHPGEDRLGVLPCQCASPGQPPTPTSTPSTKAPEGTTPSTSSDETPGAVPTPTTTSSSNGTGIGIGPGGGSTVQDPTGVGDAVDKLLGGGTGSVPTPGTTAPAPTGVLPSAGTSTIPLPLPTDTTTATPPATNPVPVPLPGLSDLTSGTSLLP